jgi:excisionase family DNA binding protein
MELELIPTGWIDTAEAAELSGYTRVHVRRLAKDEKIEARKVGRDWLINRESLETYQQNVRPGRPKES